MSHDRRDIVIQIRLDRTTTRRALSFGLIAALIAVPSYLLADSVDWPTGYPFQAGTPISSSEVNAAFAALETAIDASVLTESDVELLIANDGLDLHADTTVGGAALVTSSFFDQACPDGEMMRGIGADGSLLCAAPASKLFAFDAHEPSVSQHTPTPGGTVLGTLTVELVAGRTYVLGLMADANASDFPLLLYLATYNGDNHQCQFDFYLGDQRIGRSYVRGGWFSNDVPVMMTPSITGQQTLRLEAGCSYGSALQGPYRFYIREL